MDVPAASRHVVCRAARHPELQVRRAHRSVRALLLCWRRELAGAVLGVMPVFAESILRSDRNRLCIAGGGGRAHLARLALVTRRGVHTRAVVAVSTLRFGWRCRLLISRTFCCRPRSCPPWGGDIARWPRPHADQAMSLRAARRVMAVYSNDVHGGWRRSAPCSPVWLAERIARAHRASRRRNLHRDRRSLRSGCRLPPRGTELILRRRWPQASRVAAMGPVAVPALRHAKACLHPLSVRRAGFSRAPGSHCSEPARAGESANRSPLGTSADADDAESRCPAAPTPRGSGFEMWMAC